MKKIMIAALGLSLLSGVVVFAHQDTTMTDTTKTKKKRSKKKKDTTSTDTTAPKM